MKSVVPSLPAHKSAGTASTYSPTFSSQPRYKERRMPIRKTDRATPPTERAKRVRSVSKFLRATSNMGTFRRPVVYSHLPPPRNRSAIRAAQPQHHRSGGGDGKRRRHDTRINFLRESLACAESSLPTPS